LPGNVVLLGNLAGRILHHRHRYHILPLVRQRQMKDVVLPELQRLPVQFDGGAALLVVHYLDQVGMDPAAEARPQALGDCLLGGEPGGQGRGRVLAGKAEPGLLLGKYFLQKAPAVGLVSLLDALHLGDVGADGDDHFMMLPS